MQTYLTSIEGELQNAVAITDRPGLEELHHMLAYHLGWEGEGAGPEARGKRIRPLLVLLSASAAGAGAEQALPAAAAVELIHNFSLIHDDIEDNSPTRRGRPTLWKKWGIAQAVNAGDALFTLAHLALLRLEETASPQAALQAARLLQETCLHLTQGQYLDLSYETRQDLTLDDYWPMIAGKTGALLAACTRLGAVVAGAPDGQADYFADFGRSVGLAFQAQDDLLGIWGDAALTGKSAESDLLTGKKSLPVLYGLAQNGPFADQWRRGPVKEGEVGALAAQLEVEGGRNFTQAQVEQLTVQALQALEAACPAAGLNPAGDALKELALRLVQRVV
jgi:geranylgeranyl diphosphate synthase type I